MDIAFVSAKGGRPENEDHFSVCEKNGAVLVTVCDGLGGHAAGSTASAVAAGVFEEEFGKSDAAADGFFGRAFSAASEKLFSMAREDPALSQMKTTAVSLLVENGAFRFANIGDSRLYAFRSGKAQLLSVDHSYTKMLALAGNISNSDIRRHPDRNILLKSLGAEGEMPEFDESGPEALDGYDAFLLCTDGFWELINERKMERFLKHGKNAKQWLAKMEKTVCRKGKRIKTDNYTAVVLLNNKKEGK